MTANSNKFAVVASQRTGSTLLIRSLDASPLVFCAGELFHQGTGIHHAEYQYPYRVFGSRLLSRFVDAFARQQRVESHLRHFYSSAALNSVAVGFKLMVSHVNANPNILRFLQEEGVRLFYLYRDDTFETAMSYYKAKHSGVFHSDRNKNAVASKPIEIVADEREFKDIYGSCQNDKRHLMRAHETFGGHLMSYEEMTSQWDSFIRSLGQRIGISDLRLEPILSRLGGASSPVVVANEKLLRQQFVDCRE